MPRDTYAGEYDQEPLDLAKRRGLASDAGDQEQAYADELEPLYAEALANWDAYFSRQKEQRRSYERWRSAVYTPIPHTVTRAKVAQLLDIVASSEPIFQVDAYTDEAMNDAAGIELLLEHAHEQMGWRRVLTQLAAARSVVGTAFGKVTWQVTTRPIYYVAAKAEVEYFQARLREAEQILQQPIPSWELEPERFEQWRKDVSLTRPGLQIPPVPTSGQMIQTTYRGPRVVPIPLWDLRFSPYTSELDDQQCVIHRYTRPKQWVLDLTGPEGPFDPEAVATALDGWDTKKLSDYEDTFAQRLGYSANRSQPVRDDVEIWEKWAVGSQYPFQFILNRKAVINKTPWVFPFVHGQSSIFALRNELIPGYLLGQSDYQPVKPLVWTVNQLRRLQVDATLMATIPTLTKLEGVGVPDLSRKLVPGGVIPVARHDTFKKLFEQQFVSPDSYQQIQMLMNEIDAGTGVGSNVVGQAATVGRVTGTETTQRLRQALLPIKHNVEVFEDDYIPGVVKKMLALYWQFTESEVRIRLSGGNQLAIPVDKLAESLDMNIRLRGATRAVNREQVSQALMTFYQTFNGKMTSAEVRALMRLIGDTMGVRGMGAVVTSQGTNAIVAAEMAALQQQLQQQQQALAAPAEPADAAPLPEEPEV